VDGWRDVCGLAEVRTCTAIFSGNADFIAADMVSNANFPF
jgi:hypothetical protein